MLLALTIDAANLTPEQIDVLAANVGEILESARQNGALTAFMADLDDKAPEINFLNCTHINTS